VLLLPACESKTSGGAGVRKPDIFWIVWDTVRADRLSLDGYQRPTTPHLEEWAKGARVFENCVSPGNSTIPSHGSMFTGLLPVQHGADNRHQYLDDAHLTIAELLRAAGYATYAYSENPFITKEHNFVQGFDVAEQPFDEKHVWEVNRITWERMLGRKRLQNAPARERPVFRSGFLKAPEIVQRGVEDWLTKQPAEQPVLVFLNYMGAHGPRIPAEEYRRRMMEPDQFGRSYRMNRLQRDAFLLFNFRLKEFPAEKIETIRTLYDASILELDDHFHRLLQRLEELERLDNAVVILTSDHGEHLGDHHMFDHQLSVYESLMRVPLVIWSPGRVTPGRDRRPVMLQDLFPTILELAGVEPPSGPYSEAVSLLTPLEQRSRIGECPAPPADPYSSVKRVAPDFDPSPWNRTLRAFYEGRYKLIWGSDGRHELYDIVADPEETRGLHQQQPETVSRLAAELETRIQKLKRAVDTQPAPRLSPEQLSRLEALGYVGGSDESVEPNEQEKPDDKP
jgi:arylsulfatase A-like enzyme